MRIRTWIGACAIAVMAGAPVTAQSLADTFVAAYRNSDLLEQNRALLRAADEDVAQAVSRLRPVIDYVVSSTYSDSSVGDDVVTNAGLEASLLLYDFGATQLTIDLQKETVLALREALVDIEQNVLLRAASAHLNVGRNSANVALQENNVRLISEQLRAAQDRFEVGQITRTEVSIAEARLASSRSSFAAAQGALAQSREEYKRVTGVYPRQLASALRQPDIPRTEAEARAVARKNHPAIKEAQRNVLVAELGVAVARAALNPTLTGTASVTAGSERSSQSIGIRLSGPIYRGGNLSSVIRRAQANRDASRSTLHIVHRDIDREVGFAWADLAVAVASQNAADEEVRAARLALRGIREEFEVGQVTTLDVLDREQELLDAQTRLLSAQTDRVIAIYALLDSVGLLTVKHLGLGITTYDPSAYYNAVKDAPTVYVSPQGERLDRVLKRLNRE
ncbi:MAG: TolC family outer membrane protein [Pseudomonadota bacterium]